MEQKPIGFLSDKRKPRLSQVTFKQDNQIAMNTSKHKIQSLQIADVSAKPRISKWNYLNFLEKN